MNPQTRHRLRKSLLLCTALLCLLHVAAPMALRLASGTPCYAVGIGLELLWRAIGLCVLVFVFYLYQRVLYDLFRRKIRRWRTWSLLLLLPVLLFGARSVYRSVPSVRAQEILGTAELAPLPQSATGITVYTWWTPMSGEEYLRFRASREDIESFVAASPILKGATYRVYSEAKMRLLEPNRGGSAARDHEYVRAHPTAPPWYTQEIKFKARRYRIPRTTYGHKGEIIIDEANDTVYVKLVFS